jgi:hypothetical protein
MDERVLFERFHEALDVEPSSGGYERLRIALARSPVKPQRRPALELRWSKMGLRLAAGLALIVLAVAIAAVILATHFSTGGSVPAHSRLSIGAYQKMVNADYTSAAATWFSPCDTNQHSGCQGDATRGTLALQQWLDDLNRSEPPERFAIVDAQMRQHLTLNISALKTLLAASQAQDQAGMSRAYLSAVAGRLWADDMVPNITSSYQTTAAAYSSSLNAGKQGIDQCITCQDLAGQSAIDCSGNQASSCQDLLTATQDQIARFQAGLVGAAAPTSLAVKDSRLQLDLAQADTALMAMQSALSASDQAGFDAARISFRRALATVDRDAADILKG